MIKEISEALAKIRFDRGEADSAVVTYADMQLAHDLMRLVPDLDVDKAYQDGYYEGKMEGRDEAYEDGYSDGKADGYDEGYEYGLADGRKQGSDD